MEWPVSPNLSCLLSSQWRMSTISYRTLVCILTADYTDQNWGLILLYLASSFDKQNNKEVLKKTVFVKTTTRKPPIVWFPGDPDCGEGDLGGNSRLDTFQLIAFLLSAFNVAAIMASNVNNNNNNNNVNSNEGDTFDYIIYSYLRHLSDNVNDNNINESNTNAEVSSMVMVGLGGRNIERHKRSAKLWEQGMRLRFGSTMICISFFLRGSSFDYLGPTSTFDEKPFLSFSQLLGDTFL